MVSLVDELKMLAANPLVWWSVPTLSLFVGYSLYHWWRCPLIHRTAHISLDEAQASIDRPRIAGPRFLLLMLAGIAATVAGLKLIASATYPALAFYLLLAGVFVIQTEPARLQIREAEMRVVAAEAIGAEAKQVAVERLESVNIWLISLQAMILAGTIAFLAAF